MHESPLDPRLRELALLFLVNQLDSASGFMQHIAMAEQADNVGSYQDSALFSDDDKPMLRQADVLTLKAKVDEGLFQQATDQIGQTNVLELTAATSFGKMMVRNLNALQVELEA